MSITLCFVLFVVCGNVILVFVPLLFPLAWAGSHFLLKGSSSSPLSPSAHSEVTVCSLGFSFSYLTIWTLCQSFITSATFYVQVREFRDSRWMYNIHSCVLRWLLFGIVAPVLLLLLPFHPGETDLNSFISATPVSCLLWSHGSIWSAAAHLSPAQNSLSTLSLHSSQKLPVTPEDTRKVAAGEVHFMS